MNHLLIADQIANQRHVVAIRRAFLLNFPLMVLGAFATMLNEVPVLWCRQYIMSWFGSGWSMFWQNVVSASLDGIALLLVISVSYFLAEQHLLVQKGQVQSLAGAAVSFACFMVLIQPFSGDGTKGFPFTWSGMEGIFLAVFTALLATELFLHFMSFNKLSIEIFTDVADPILHQAMACLLPAIGTVLIFTVFKLCLTQAVALHLNIELGTWAGNCFHNIASPWLKLVGFILLVHLFWFFGLHGNKIMEPFLQHIQMINVQLPGNMDLSQVEPSFTKTFLDTFVLLGGSGSTICLLITLYLVARRGNVAWLAKLSILPAIFNINELLIYGLPIVLNPIFLIPFMMVPVILAAISYLAVSCGWVSIVASSVHWTTPLFFSGYLATQSWQGVGLQLFGVIVGTLIYLPFVLLNEKQKKEEITRAFSLLLVETTVNDPQARCRLLTRKDNVGTLARVLLQDIKTALTNGEFFLEYQPQVNHCNQVVGVEALLRWQHKQYGRVPAPVIVAIAEENGLIREIGKWVQRTACSQLSIWRTMGLDSIRMSINASASELQDQSFSTYLQAVAEEYGIPPQALEIEITETVAMDNAWHTTSNLETIRHSGTRIAIDDFGMGHTSLRYIKDYQIDTLKIDGILSKEVVADKNCQEIIASITALCASLNIEVIVEYVETEEQRKLLERLGCLYYQGYYYSPPLSAACLIDYINNRQ